MKFLISLLLSVPREEALGGGDLEGLRNKKKGNWSRKTNKVLFLFFLIELWLIVLIFPSYWVVIFLQMIKW